MSEEPEQDRRRRRLLWLLLFFTGATAAVAAGAGIGTLVFHHGSADSPRHHVTASGVGFASDRDDSGGGSGRVGSPSPSPSAAPASAPTAITATTTTTSVEARGTTHVTTTSGHPAVRLTVSAVVQGDLYPGRPHSLIVSIGNPGAQAVRVTAVNVSVDQPSAAGCLPSWFTTSGGLPSHLVISAGSTGQATLQLWLRNLPRRNQDACKGVHIPLKVSVAAVEFPS